MRNLDLTRWQVCSSADAGADGKTLSDPSHSVGDAWIPATVPGTVVGAQVGAGSLPAPWQGEALRTMPGYKHGVKDHFSFHAMPLESPYRKPWWYRTTFELDTQDCAHRCRLRFDGINFAANLWFNGRLVASRQEMCGSYCRFAFDVSSLIRPGTNVVAVELFAPRPDDLCLTFVDWNPVPPDDAMGIWQPVSVEISGPVIIARPLVVSTLEGPDLAQARLELSLELVNMTDCLQSGILHCLLEEGVHEIEFSLPPGESSRVIIDSSDWSQLHVRTPRLWWPWQLGTPHLYSLTLSVMVDGTCSQQTVVDFGIRQITSRLNDYGSREFSINGVALLLRGAAWAPDLLLRHSGLQDEIDIAYVRNCNFNVIRFEGFLGNDHLWDACDRAGILVMAGWSCCNHWERWERWQEDDYRIAQRSLRDQLLRLRNHPALLVWLYGSDFPPPERVERLYLDSIEELCPHLPVLSSAAARPTVLQGETGVKMSGPYGYVPAEYWLDERMPGVAYGFNTETGPGMCIPDLESLERFLPPDQCRPGSAAWNLHCGCAAFIDTRVDEDAVARAFGPCVDTADFVRCSQVLAYDAWRAMFEAYGRTWPRGTGVIGWMLNSAWPSLIWQLYDWYNQPTAALFGARKGCEVLHVQYHQTDRSVWVVNQGLNGLSGAVVDVRMVDEGGALVATLKATVDCPPMTRMCVGTLEFVQRPSWVLVDCRLLDQGEVVSHNQYWPPEQPSQFAPRREAHEWFYWPLERHADLRPLRNLLPARCRVQSVTQEDDAGTLMRVKLHNPGKTIAFGVILRLHDETAGSVLAPAYWSDNFISVLPGEQREVTVRSPALDGRRKLSVVASAWNSAAPCIGSQ